ncbi:phosphotransferase family protein [Janibacter sp. CX7]|uniref:phosphotransferase family protein n=1 Tax=Janibacter sp. CX7 TaxID=2963431 RepID=UPI0020CF9228|nr:phosphotransferase family protein [Janibacter sp. CX7]UTT66607.1 phosphotransferase family protein [Janibacter sp. CX7]
MTEGLREDALTGWLVGLGVGLQAPLTYERVGLGQSNLTYLVTDAKGERLVLRRPPLGELLASAHDVAREHRILSALQGTDVPLPRVLGLCEDPSVTDVPVLAVSHVEGTVVDERPDAEALAPAARHAIGLALVDTLGRIHGVDLTAVGLDDLASHKPYAARQLKRWSGQWELSRTRELPALEQLTERLRALEPEPGEVVLVHGDSHLRNVIVDPDDASVRAILDWELCTLGDPLADLGTVLAYWPQPGDRPTMRFDASMVEGFATREELVERYVAATGRDVTHVPFWHGLGLWKLAIILEGVRRRQLDDPRNLTAMGRIPAEAVDELVACAHAVLDAD